MMFSVVAPSKTASNLVPCVAAIRSEEPALGPSRIIIVDDGLGERGVSWDAIGCTVIPNERRGGQFVFSAAINVGIREALKDSSIHGIVATNDDALLESPGGFSLLAAEAEAHPEYGIIGATTNKTGQPLQWRRTGEGSGLRTVPHIAFVCVYIPRRTLETVGLLDERYCLPGKYGCEDLDYCEAVTRAGLKVGVHDGCFVDHASLTSSFRGDPSAPGDFLPHLELCIAKWGGSLQCHPTAVNLLRRAS